MAATTGRMQTFDFSFDLTNQYTFWSGTIAALFLFCSYFGTDQSQVQRYLTARSVNEARRSLVMSGYWKIPLQAVVLLLGVLIFVFYVFTPPPMLFSAVHTERMLAGAAAPEYTALQSEFDGTFEARREAALAFAEARRTGDDAARSAAGGRFADADRALSDVRTRAAALVRQTGGEVSFTDTNYIIPTFITSQLPVGIVGLLFVAIMMAAASTISSELNSLSTATVMDFYRRLAKPGASDAHYLRISKVVTGLWGLFACGVAVWAAELGSLIEVVNRFGSFFYGSILGVFILAILVPRANGHGAFFGLIAGMASVAWAAYYTDVAFLWHNVVGAVVVLVAGTVISVATGRGRRAA
jgi:Na+/proline symporter